VGPQSLPLLLTFCNQTTRARPTQQRGERGERERRDFLSVRPTYVFVYPLYPDFGRRARVRIFGIEDSCTRQPALRSANRGESFRPRALLMFFDPGPARRLEVAQIPDNPVNCNAIEAVCTYPDPPSRGETSGQVRSSPLFSPLSFLPLFLWGRAFS